MFKLSLDLEPESGPIITIPTFDEETPRIVRKELAFLDSLPKELQDIVEDIRWKAKGNKCPKLKNDASGAFGSIEISQNKVKKLLGLIQKKDQGTLLRSYGQLKKKSQLYFLINRLNNYCKDIRTFVNTTRKIFPNNFLKIYKCNLCQGTKGKKATPDVYVEMALGKGKTLKEVLKKKSISKKELESVFVQIYYISMVLNMKKLYHNDLKPANIIVAKSDHPIIYDALKSGGDFIKMRLPKGSYYPVFVDYDLNSKNQSETVEAPGGAFLSPGSPDFSFFAVTTSKVDRKQEKFLDQLPEFDTPTEIKKGIKEMYDAIKKHNKVLSIKHTTTKKAKKAKKVVKKSQKGGAKKKRTSKLLKKIMPKKHAQIKAQQKALKNKEAITKLTERRNKMRMIEKRNGPRSQQLSKLIQQLKMN